MAISSFAQDSPGYYAGTFQNWVWDNARTLAENYMRGMRDFDQFSGASTGQPNADDFGSASGGKTGHISVQTYNFFADYLAANGGSDPYLLKNFGAPPTKQATEDPNSPSKMNAANNASNEKIAAGNNATSLGVAGIAAAAQAASDAAATQRVAMQVAESWKEAVLNDATRRYVAEGDWGTQRYVAELQDKGATDRLMLSLGSRDKDRAQEALAEANRHSEALQGLALEVAKFDAELAANPRDWIKYAAWLKSKDIIVNGLTLAMAGDIVPDQQITPQMVAATGDGVSAIQTAQAALTSGATGGSTSAQDAFGPQTQELLSANRPGGAGNVGPQTTQQPPGSTGNYADIARSLLATAPAAQGAPDPGALQDVSNSLKTAGGRTPAFGAWGGPTTNSLGMKISEPTGQSWNYRNFTNLLPSAQAMKFGEVSSIGRYEPDVVRELDASRPKGNATGSVTYG